MHRKLRQYEQYWLSLKRDHRVNVLLRKELLDSFDSAGIEKAVARLKKAIMKEKYMDTRFKSRNPSARLEFEIRYLKSSEIHVVIITMENYFIIVEPNVY
jgi:hypothetical protein